MRNKEDRISNLKLKKLKRHSMISVKCRFVLRIVIKIVF